MPAGLDYREPDIIAILIFSSFLLLLNITNNVFDRFLSCGLVAQILVGTAWGTPGFKLLDETTEESITLLGYIGLILLVFEGGLETSTASLRRNLVLSSLVAITGIVFPIGLSFVLGPIIGASPLQSFAAGAALCSTSLGTIFTLLRSSGLVETRLGSILTSAAMLDDIVGLIMVQVISNLQGTFQVVSVLRPLGVSVACILLSISICLLLRYCGRPFLSSSTGSWLCNQKHSAFLAQTTFLIAMVTAASYAGTSNLFAAYLTGVCLSWWSHWSSDLEMSTDTAKPGSINATSLDTGNESPGAHQSHPSGLPVSDTSPKHNSPVSVYHQYYRQVADSILKPFFFASIGFAIPITLMFQGQVFWRGLVYALLMCMAKMVTGLWLLRHAVRSQFSSWWFHTFPHKRAKRDKGSQRPGVASNGAAAPGSASTEKPSSRGEVSTSQVATEIDTNTNSPSFYPAAILGMAMVARGEIGFLIAATAQSSHVFEQTGSQDLYLTVIWAITLCTIIGPIAMGVLVRRLRSFEKSPLGSYGVA